jgi:hypothetical protein
MSTDERSHALSLRWGRLKIEASGWPAIAVLGTIFVFAAVVIVWLRH